VSESEGDEDGTTEQNHEEEVEVTEGGKNPTNLLSLSRLHSLVCRESHLSQPFFHLCFPDLMLWLKGEMQARGIKQKDVMIEAHVDKYPRFPCDVFIGHLVLLQIFAF
jgi:hypothetical protein